MPDSQQGKFSALGKFLSDCDFDSTKAEAREAISLFWTVTKIHHLIYPLTARVVGAPQMISQPVSWQNTASSLLNEIHKDYYSLKINQFRVGCTWSDFGNRFGHSKNAEMKNGSQVNSTDSGLDQRKEWWKTNSKHLPELFTHPE